MDQIDLNTINEPEPTKPKKHMSPKRKKIILIISIIIVLFLAGATYYWFKIKPADTPTKPKAEVKTEEPKTIEPVKPVLTESPLDGTMVDASLANRHPLAIMVENHPQARPQTGLIDASIVYETLAEGGITRFMAIYGPKIPETVGPVRSARTYYVDWAEEYDAFYTHFGGASDALKKITNDGVKDIDGMKVGAPMFWRKYYPGVTASEHTAFTSPAKLYNYAFNTKKWPNTTPTVAFKFKDDPILTERSKGGTLTVNFSGNATYIAKFTYDPATNTWPRTLAGVAHKDRATGAQISPKNIIVQSASEIYKAGKKDHDVQTIGSGAAKFFFDGKMTEGTWTKSVSKSHTEFKDATGIPVIFDRGQTWIAVIKPAAAVTWVPVP